MKNASDKDLLHLTSRMEWDKYAKVHSLPSSYFLIQEHGSWKKVKEHYGVTTRRRVTVDHATLLSIIREQKKHLTTTREWDEYSKEHDLPSSRTLINHFKTWNKVKEKADLEPTPNYVPVSYNKDKIVSLLKEHPATYENQVTWNQYAKSKNLPTYKTIRKYLTFEEFERIVGKDDQ